MDKQTNRALKIILNGKEEISNGKGKLASLMDKSSAKKEKLTVSTWEEKAKSETAAAEEKAEKDEFPWLLPDESDIYEEDPKVVAPPKSKGPKKTLPVSFRKLGEGKSRREFPLKQLLITAVIAVAMGLGFGTMALKFMSADPEAQGAAQGGGSNPSLPASVSSQTNEPAQKPAAGGAALATYVVQAGKFSSEGSADSAKNSLISKGYPSVKVKEQDSYFVYAGLAGEKGQAQAIGKGITEDGIEAWGGKAKSWTIPKEAKAFEKDILTLSSLSADAAAGNPADASAVAAAIQKIEKLPSSSFAGKLKEAAEALKKSPDAKGGKESQQILLTALAGLQ
ncbi:SPOR domain-containing protein [Metabacillus sp. GX 13764]|uniref:SPOR domain-containing protein n=1 Tax=Metabacillus kandeliae TaxID=2900151 RepID=UPI001E414DC4|nr:SPOR domain-containing protein [Metabacillus kandeliae]MCD7032916.1 SPOR domain-containing protein [Metabacillus kandeliae]